MSKHELAIVDVQYGSEGALAACVVAARSSDESPIEERIAQIASVKPYRPGAFYERELPCLVEVLSKVRSAFQTLIIDGYVHLDAQGTPGLGAHLYAHFGEAFPVIGVAKTAYRGSDFAEKVQRGESQKPLFVTAVGVPLRDAARLVAQMHGAHRIPTLLARVDHLARGLAQPITP